MNYFWRDIHENDVSTYVDRVENRCLQMNVLRTYLVTVHPPWWSSRYPLAIPLLPCSSTLGLSTSPALASRPLYVLDCKNRPAALLSDNFASVLSWFRKTTTAEESWSLLSSLCNRSTFLGIPCLHKTFLSGWKKKIHLHQTALDADISRSSTKTQVYRHHRHRCYHPDEPAVVCLSLNWACCARRQLG